MNTNQVYKQFERIALDRYVSSFSWGGPADEKAIKSIIDYFHNSGELPREKGLFIRGNLGSGKTLTIRILQQMRGVNVALNPVERVVSDYNAGGDEILSIYKREKTRVFDDLGSERDGRYYGSPVNVMAETILARYDLFQRTRTITHFTTNLSNDQLRERYGDRVYDRLLEMTSVIVLGRSANFKSRRADAKPPPVPIVQKTEKTPEESPETVYLWLKDFIRRRKELPRGAKWILAYRYANENDLLSGDIEFRKTYLEKVRNDLREERKYATSKIMQSIAEEILRSEDRIKIEARVRLVKDHFREMLKTEIVE